MQIITVSFNLEQLKAARFKYLQLGGEIEDKNSYADLCHSHSTLGIFLAEILGYDLWKTVDEMTEKDLPIKIYWQGPGWYGSKSAEAIELRYIAEIGLPTKQANEVAKDNGYLKAVSYFEPSPYMIVTEA